MKAQNPLGHSLDVFTQPLTSVVDKEMTKWLGKNKVRYIRKHVRGEMWTIGGKRRQPLHVATTYTAKSHKRGIYMCQNNISVLLDF